MVYNKLALVGSEYYCIMSTAIYSPRLSSTFRLYRKPYWARVHPPYNAATTAKPVTREEQSAQVMASPANGGSFPTDFTCIQIVSLY